MKNEDLSSYYTDTREFYLARVASADAATFAPDDRFSLEEETLLRELFALVLRQAMVIQGYNGEYCDHKIVYPEVLVMLSIILCKCFPLETHEHHASVMFVVSRVPVGGPGECPPVILRRRAELVVSRIGGVDQRDSTRLGPDDHDAPDDLAHAEESGQDSDVEDEEVSCITGITHYRGLQQLLYSKSPDPQGPTDACVAHSSNIHLLLMSALYHRLSVGTCGPSIGLAYEKKSLVVHVYIAWLEEVVEEGNDLPDIHICPPTPFNLSDPLSALTLALLLYRSASLFERSSADKVLPWRADFCPRGILDDLQLSHTDYSSREAITLWAKAVYEATVPHVEMAPKSKQKSMQPHVPMSNKGGQVRDAPKTAQAAGKAAQESDSQSMSTPTARSSQSSAKGLPKAITQPSRKCTQSESSTSATGSVKSFLSTSTFVNTHPTIFRSAKGCIL